MVRDKEKGAKRMWKQVCNAIVRSGAVTLYVTSEEEKTASLARILNTAIGKNGVDVLKEIKEIDPDIQTAIVTAYPDSKLLAEAMKYGPLMIVPKPIDGSKVYEVTRKLLAQKRIFTEENNNHA